MFFLLRKIVLALFAGLFLGLFAWFYLERHRLQPVADYGELWWSSRNVETRSVGELDGEVVQVFTGDTLQLRGSDGLLYNFRLTGLAAPPAAAARDQEARRLFLLSKTNLTELVLSNRVRISMTYLSPLRAGAGIVRQGTNNINVRMVESGWVRVNRESIRELPVPEQYRLVAAERKAQEQQLALWR